jgi:site-specific recombinase XerD
LNLEGSGSLGLGPGSKQQPLPATVTRAVKDFLARDQVPNTKKAFSSDLRKFVAVFGIDRVSEITGHDIARHLDGLTTRNGEPVSGATYNRHFGTLLNFFRWLEKLKEARPDLRARLLRYTNPMAGMEKKKLPQCLPRPLSKDQVTTILGRIDSARDKALFTLLYDSDVRIQEALNLGVEDVDFQTDRAWIQGKGGRERRTLLSQRAKHLLKRYLRTRGTPTSGPLFLSRQYSDREGRRLSYAMAHRLFRRYAEGIVSRGKPATIRHLRHAFVQNGLE